MGGKTALCDWARLSCRRINSPTRLLPIAFELAVLLAAGSPSGSSRALISRLPWLKRPRKSGGSARTWATKPGAGASLRVELVQLRHGFLHHLPATPHRAHQPPIGMCRAVLATDRVPQIQPRFLSSTLAYDSPTSRATSTKSRHYTAISRF
jgi:hypothetical protein